MTPFKQVVLIGPAGIGEMAWFIRMALLRMGSRVTCLDDRQYLRPLPGRGGRALQVVQTRAGRGPLHSRLQRHVVAGSRGADLIITTKGENLRPETVAALSRIAPTINWYSDHPFLEQNFAAVDRYTFFCPKDSWSTERITALGYANVRCLPHAADPLLMQSARPESVDIAMMGSNYPYRARHLDHLAQLGMSMAIHGGVVAGMPSTVTQHREPAVGQQYADAMASCRIALNTHTPRDVAGGNQRLFDAAAAGKCQLTESLPDSRSAFPAGGPTYFTSLAELGSLAENLLDDPEERYRLGRIARTQVIESHTYEHRIRTLDEWLSRW